MDLLSITQSEQRNPGKSTAYLHQIVTFFEITTFILPAILAVFDAQSFQTIKMRIRCSASDRLWEKEQGY
jgi:hypothetical protein